MRVGVAREFIMSMAGKYMGKVLALGCGSGGCVKTCFGLYVVYIFIYVSSGS